MRWTWAMLMASWAANAQPMPLEELVCSLAIPMLETSGLAPYTNDVWITHNDGGGEPELYFFSQTDGHIVGNLKLNGAENVDWEELAFDPNGHFYTLNLSPDTLYLLESEVEDELVLKGFVTAPCRLTYEVFDQLGRRLMYGLDTDTVHGRLLRKWDVSESLPKGSFVLYVRCGQQKQAFRFSKTRRRQSKATENPAEEGKK